MGLDIYIHKAIKITRDEAQTLLDSSYKKNITSPLKDVVYLFDIDDNIKLKHFEALANTVNVERYDVEKIYAEYDFGDGDIIGQSDDWENIDTPDEKCFMIWELKDGRILKIEEKTLPRITVSIRVIAGAEIGYQRKGANMAFYNDNIWGDYVVDVSTLNEHWNKYFSGNVKKEKEELSSDTFTGFDVEYNLNAEENRNNFKKNIVDKFIDGTTFVGYL